MKYIQLHTKRGYTLLFAVLIASLVLGVAVFILSVSRKQYLLSATARESMYAVYASESGIECATLEGNEFFYPFDVSGGQFKCKNFPNDDVNITFIEPNDEGSGMYTDVNGDKHSIFYTDTKNNQYPIESEADFRLAFSDKNDTSRGIYACAVVSIIGYEDNINRDPITDENVPVTVVRSRGYNVCVPNNATNPPTWGPDTTSPRTVERAREVIYR